MASPKFTLNKADGKKILIGAGITIGGALLTYITQVIASIEPGPWTPVLVTGWAVVVNVARKYLAGPLEPTAEEFNTHTVDPTAN